MSLLFVHTVIFFMFFKNKEQMHNRLDAFSQDTGALFNVYALCNVYLSNRQHLFAIVESANKEKPQNPRIF